MKIIANGLCFGENAYLKDTWNKMDGFLVTISIVDLIIDLVTTESPKIFGVLRVFRLLRTLRPLRVITRAPGLRLVVETLLSAIVPIGNVLIITMTFFVIFAILGVQVKYY